MLRLFSAFSMGSSFWACAIYFLGIQAQIADLSLFEAIKRNDLPAVLALLKQGADPNAAKFGQSEIYRFDRSLARRGPRKSTDHAKEPTALMVACQQSDPRIVAALLDSGGDLHSVDKNGSSILMWAAARPAPHIVKFLLHRGAGVHWRNTWGETPLISAAQGADAATVRILLEAGAQIDAKTAGLDDSMYWALLRHDLAMQRVLREFSVLPHSVASQGLPRSRNTVHAPPHIQLELRISDGVTRIEDAWVDFRLINTTETAALVFEGISIQRGLNLRVRDAKGRQVTGLFKGGIWSVPEAVETDFGELRPGQSSGYRSEWGDVLRSLPAGRHVIQAEYSVNDLGYIPDRANIDFPRVVRSNRVTLRVDARGVTILDLGMKDKVKRTGSTWAKRWISGADVRALGFSG